MGRFDGKTAVVTGAASGMGREVVRQLVSEGARVTALDLDFPDIKPGNTGESPSVIYQKHDVTVPEQWDVVVAKLKDCYTRVDILVNAAGVMDYAPLHEMELSSWRRVIDVDLDGVMLGMKAIIPLMRAGGGGAIINFSSALATVVLPGSPAYHAAKAAVTQLTRNAAITYAADKVRVNAIHPGVIETPMVMKQSKEFNEAAVARTPLGRMGTADEIAKFVLFMASDDAAFMTGSAVVVDGGFSLM
ncbi:2,5-dichloro-2,5-cyclohexadiene-1,4-diol dehydrogenase [Xylaria longipes]|nr:2,5-dichloro-2,5-cyclohexadiene-1,4-diol dehydrogenase [Xylaria longipes]